MKMIFDLIIFVLGIAVAMWLLPLEIGIMAAILKFQEGKILGGVISVIIGLLCEVVWLWIFCSGKVPIGDGEGEDCPYCGSGDTDGNHCYTCDDDF